mgnify:CR=1 FL=1
MTTDEDGNTVPEVQGTVGHIPDLLADSSTWQWAGVSFGEYDTLLLQKSLKTIFAKGATSLRFWGKIKGSEKDYFIVEAVQAGDEEVVDGDEKGEARGTGLNQYVYYVANSPLEEWIELPDVKPSQVRMARQVKVQFSGNLDKAIFTNPFYFDKERTLLRAQIARISAHC